MGKDFLYFAHFVESNMEENTAESALSKACRLAGSLTKLAQKVDVTKGAVGQWGDRVPAERVLDVARAVGFAVTPHELRPDLYPNPTDGLPQEVARS